MVTAFTITLPTTLYSLPDDVLDVIVMELMDGKDARRLAQVARAFTTFGGDAQPDNKNAQMEVALPFALTDFKVLIEA